MADEGHPIGAVERWTGLGADTIRAWERRHGAIQPVRGPGKVRRYGPEQVRRLLLLKEATRRGHAIGQIAQLDAEALRRLVREDHDALEVLSSWHDQRQSVALADAYLCSLARLDVDEGRRLLLLARQLFRPMCSSFIEPLVHAVEERWSVSDDGPAPYVRSLFLQHLRGLLFGPAPAAGPCKVLVAGAEGWRPWTLLAALVMAQEGLEAVVLEEVASPVGLAWPAGLSGAHRRVFVGRSLETDFHGFLPGAVDDVDGSRPGGLSTTVVQLEAVARAWRLSSERGVPP